MSGRPTQKEVVTAATGRELPELLRELYVLKRFTQREIADALSVSRDTVIRWLAEYEITREDRDPLERLVSA